MSCNIKCAIQGDNGRRKPARLEGCYVGVPIRRRELQLADLWQHHSGQSTRPLVVGSKLGSKLGPVRFLDAMLQTQSTANASLNTALLSRGTTKSHRQPDPSANARQF